MFQKRYLENGVPVLIEKIDGFRSAVVGIWVKTGSRFETPVRNGISHFIEHMLFKGTRSRTAEDIAVEIDSIGGDLNAYTSRENTTFYVKVLDEYLHKGTGLLGDIFLHSLFDSQEIEKEKGIIGEEIRMVEDTPDEYVFDLFNAEIWGRSGLGQTILGTAETIRDFKREDVLAYLDSFYTAENIIIACAGNVDVEKTMDFLREGMLGSRNGRPETRSTTPEFRPGMKVFQKDLSEVHICVGFRGIPANSPERYAMLILNTLLGSGVSSRLFQEIREKKGLVYSINSFLSSYADVGSVGIYAGASKDNYREVMDLIVKESCYLRESMTVGEFERTKKQLKGNILLGLESSSARMNNIARQEIYHGRYYSPEEIIRDIEAVKIDDARALSEKTFDKENMAITLLGPAEEPTGT